MIFRLLDWAYNHLDYQLTVAANLKHLNKEELSKISGLPILISKQRMLRKVLCDYLDTKDQDRIKEIEDYINRNGLSLATSKICNVRSVTVVKYVGEDPQSYIHIGQCEVSDG